MKKILKYMRLFHFVFLMLGVVILVSALPFKTQYNTVYLNVDSTIQTVEDADKITAEMTNARNQDQTLLFNYFDDAEVQNKPEFNKAAVVEFNNQLNAANYFILYFGIISVIAIGFLFFLQNHRRRVFYGTNMAGAVLVCLGIVVMGVILLVKLFGLMGMISQNKDLLNVVALLQNANTRAKVYFNRTDGLLIKNMYYVTNASLLGYVVLDLVFMLYSLFILFLTGAKFSRTKDRRQEILQKAVENND